MTDVVTLLARTQAYLRKFAAGKVHEDDLASHAGYAVAFALAKCRDRALVFTYACRAARSVLLDSLRRNVRYVHPEPAYWAALVAPATAHEVAETPLEAAEAGATIRDLVRRFGLTWYRARQIIARVKNART